MIINHRDTETQRKRVFLVLLCVSVSLWLFPVSPVLAQSARAAAPIDLTGYWVSVVTEDWRYRMLTPFKGDYPGIPLNAEGKKTADAWDPAKDEAGGGQCKAYGAAAVLRVPGRLHITWQDDETLKIET